MSGRDTIQRQRAGGKRLEQGADRHMEGLLGLLVCVGRWSTARASCSTSLACEAGGVEISQKATNMFRVQVEPSCSELKSTTPSGPPSGPQSQLQLPPPLFSAQWQSSSFAGAAACTGNTGYVVLHCDMGRDESLGCAASAGVLPTTQHEP